MSGKFHSNSQKFTKIQALVALVGWRGQTTVTTLCFLSFYVTPTGSLFRRLRGGKTRDGLGSGISSEKEKSLSVLFTTRLRTVLGSGGVVQGVLVSPSSSSVDARAWSSLPSSSAASDVAASWWPLRQQAAAFGHIPQRVRRCLGQVCTLRPSPGLW